MALRAIEADVLIIGGGVAGLWTLAVLRARGIDAMLIERDALGAGQTIATQGIIHGGLKYSLGGSATSAARSIASMPEAWRRAMTGEGDVDLRDAILLSEHQHLWTTGGVGARLAGIAASRAIRTDVVKLTQGDRPEAFAGAPAGIDVYRVDEPVLEPRSVLRAVAGRHGDRIRRAAEPRIADTDGGRVSVEARGDGAQSVTVHARIVVLAAGAGNEELLHGAGLADGAVHMQRRPLHMVMARGRALPPLYAHAVGTSTRPRATITSQHDLDGCIVWYIGGDIAETGVRRDRDGQIRHAREELSRLLPWVDLEGTQWATLRIDRAEQRTKGGTRPDEPFVGPASTGEAGRRVLVVWPTKLAFAPSVANLVLDRVRSQGIEPTDRPSQASAVLTSADIAPLPWEAEGVRWS